MFCALIGWKPGSQSRCEFLESGVDATAEADAFGQLSIDRRRTRLADAAKRRLHGLLGVVRFALDFLEESLVRKFGKKWFTKLKGFTII